MLGEAAEGRAGQAEPRPPRRGAHVWAEGHGTQEGKGSQVLSRAQVVSFEKRSAPPNSLSFLSPSLGRGVGGRLLEVWLRTKQEAALLLGALYCTPAGRG